jgi:hypothetical protein
LLDLPISFASGCETKAQFLCFRYDGISLGIEPLCTRDVCIDGIAQESIPSLAEYIPGLFKCLQIRALLREELRNPRYLIARFKCYQRPYSFLYMQKRGGKRLQLKKEKEKRMTCFHKNASFCVVGAGVCNCIQYSSMSRCVIKNVLCFLFPHMSWHKNLHTMSFTASATIFFSKIITCQGLEASVFIGSPSLHRGTLKPGVYE